ncbi:MAG: hypothetical protein H6831_16775 [Planctomycetes bacterium]|nr:hypothetical protein [Planctomycetota bacterium]MCB9906057.1 hypothetical protein [Planctomycetota bacterium]
MRRIAREPRRARVVCARRALLAGVAWLLTLFVAACSSEDEPPPRDTIVVLWWEGVPPELCFDAAGASASATPTLARLECLRSVPNYVPSSDLSETRLTSVLAESGRIPAAMGLLDWGVRRRPEGPLARKLREAGYLRCAAVSRAELACLASQFDRFFAPPFGAAASASAHDAAWRALAPELDAALETDRPVFLLVATDVLARRAPPSPTELAPHLAARLERLESVQTSAEAREELADMRARLAADPAIAGEALRERLVRRRGDAYWDVLQAAEADARLARADAMLAGLLARLAETGRRDRLRLVVAGGAARDPWSAAIETNAGGAAPLYTLGLPRFDGIVQESDLRAALSAVVTQPARADARVARPSGPADLVAVVARAGETRFLLTLEAPDGSTEQWNSDVTGEARVASEPDVEVRPFPWRTAWPVERVAARNAGAAAATLELTAEAGESVRVPDAKGKSLELEGGGRVLLRASRWRPGFVARWRGTAITESDCAVGARTLAETDLPTVPRASADVWPEDGPAPRLDLAAAGAWREVTLGAEGDGPAELLVEAWPTRLEPDSVWLELSDGASLEPHPLRPGAWIARGEAPLVARILRSAGGELAFRAELGGVRVGASETRVDRKRAVAAGEVTILLSAGVWNDATLYGARPQGPALGLELLGPPPSAPITLPSAAERRFLLRASRTR